MGLAWMFHPLMVEFRTQGVTYGAAGVRYESVRAGERDEHSQVLRIPRIGDLKISHAELQRVVEAAALNAEWLTPQTGK